MTNRRFTLLTFAAVSLATALLPAAANAQGSIWDRIRDRQQRERDDDRRNRNDDDRYGRRGGRISDYERRQLRDVARRINDRSRDLQRDIDRLLDHTRYDGSRREDDINAEARSFHDAAQRFRDIAGDSNELYRSSGEARRLLDEASRLNRMLGRVRLDSRTGGDWSQIRNDLRTVADIYSLRFNDYDGGYRGGNDHRRNGDYGDRYPQ